MSKVYFISEPRWCCNESHAIRLVFEDIINGIFLNIAQPNEYINIRNSKVCFIRVIPEELKIELPVEFYSTNEISYLVLSDYKYSDILLKDLKYKKWKYLCYSSNTYYELKSLGLDAYMLKYYVNPKNVLNVSYSNGNILGYWNRTNFFNIELVNVIIEHFKVNQCIIYNEVRTDVNANADYIDINKLKCDVILYNKKTIDRDEYMARFRDINIFLCPRYCEGIGLSYLEQGSRGCFLIGHDNFTMNEYITNGVNGCLLDVCSSDKQSILNVDNDIQKYGSNFKNDSIKGYMEYKYNIFDFFSITI
jgi:hypothetical protein